MADALTSYSPVVLAEIALITAGPQRLATDTRHIPDAVEWETGVAWETGVEWEGGRPYRGTLLSVDIHDELPDLEYLGIKEPRTATLKIANHDDGINQTWEEIVAAEEIRDQWVRIQRYDASDGFTHLCYGKIQSYILGDVVTINISYREPILSKVLPIHSVTTDRFSTTAWEEDLGKPVNICLGYCYNVPLRCIQEDTTNDYYDYLIGYGTTEGLNVDHGNGLGVKREGQLVDTSEYTAYDGSQGSPFSGYAFLRFTKRQTDYAGRHYTLTADVKGLELGGASANRNFATCIDNLLTNSTWGLGESTDSPSISSAETTLATANGYYCDALISSFREADGILHDLCFPARAYLERASDGEWEITVDADVASSETFKDGADWSNCEVLDLVGVQSDNIIKDLWVKYALKKSYDLENNSAEITHSVRGYGRDKEVVLPFVHHSDTAEKVTSYLTNRTIYSEEEPGVIAELGPEGRVLWINDVITLTCDRRNISSQEYRIHNIDWDGIGPMRVLLKEHSASIYSDETLTPTTAPASVFGYSSQYAVIISVTEPSNPVVDQMWLDTSTNPDTLKRYNGSTWDTLSTVEGSWSTLVDDDGNKPEDGADVTPPLPSDENLVGYWSFDEGTGSTAVDNSGNGYDATLGNTPTWAAGKSGKCLDFDAASNEYAQLLTPSDAGTAIGTEQSGAVSVSLWFRSELASTGDSGARIITRDSSDYWCLYVDQSAASGSQGLTFQMNSGTTLTKSSLSTNTWYHAVFVLDYDSGEAKLYVDGALEDSNANLGASTGSSRGVCVAVNEENGPSAGSNQFDGKADEPRIYSAALTASEVKALYLNPSGNQYPQIPQKSVKGTWETKSSNFTANAFGEYRIDTSSSTVTMTLPASPAENDWIQWIDLNESFGTNKFIIAPNGNNFHGATTNVECLNSMENGIIEYTGATQGWVIT